MMIGLRILIAPFLVTCTHAIEDVAAEHDSGIDDVKYWQQRLVDGNVVGGHGGSDQPTHSIYKGSPQAELWDGKNKVRTGSSLVKAGAKNLKDRISSMKQVLQQLGTVAQQMTDSIKKAESAGDAHPKLKAELKKKEIANAMSNFKAKVEAFDQLRTKVQNKTTLDYWKEKRDDKSSLNYWKEKRAERLNETLEEILERKQKTKRKGTLAGQTRVGQDYWKDKRDSKKKYWKDKRKHNPRLMDKPDKLHHDRKVGKEYWKGKRNVLEKDGYSIDSNGHRVYNHGNGSLLETVDSDGKGYWKGKRNVLEKDGYSIDSNGHRVYNHGNGSLLETVDSDGKGSLLETKSTKGEARKAELKKALKEHQDKAQKLLDSIHRAQKEGGKKLTKDKVVDMEKAMSVFNAQLREFDQLREQTRSEGVDKLAVTAAGEAEEVAQQEEEQEKELRRTLEMNKRTKRAEALIQTRQAKMTGKTPDDGVLNTDTNSWLKNNGLQDGPYETRDLQNLYPKIFYNGVCPGWLLGCIQYRVALYASLPHCIQNYMEDTFPILAAIRCAVLKGCSGFSYGMNQQQILKNHLGPVAYWSEEYEYTMDVGIVKFYGQELKCNLDSTDFSPKFPRNLYDAQLQNILGNYGSRANFVLYQKLHTEKYVQTNYVPKQRAVVLGGGGCFSVMSQAGYFSGLMPMQASGSIAMVATSSGGTWFFAMTSMKGGGLKGRKWPTTWDSVDLRKRQEGIRPIWRAMFQLYMRSHSVKGLFHNETQMNWMVDQVFMDILGCSDSLHFEDCNNKKRSRDTLQKMFGVSFVCARNAHQFRKFLQGYLVVLGAVYSHGFHLNADGQPSLTTQDGSGINGKNIMGSLWAGVIKNWLFVPNSLLLGQSNAQVGWSYAGRWVNCVTHFTKSFAGEFQKQHIVPDHRYVSPFEMIAPAAFQTKIKFTQMYETVVSTAAASSNVPVQALLDIIWMLESEMCVTGGPTSGDPNATKVAEAVEKYIAPWIGPGKVLGSVWDNMNQFNVGFYNKDLPGAESLLTPSPMILAVSYFLPPSNTLGYQGDSATTDDGGVMSAMLAIDSFDHQFRPSEILVLLTTTDTWQIQRYFLKKATMWDLFEPVSSKIAGFGFDCTKSHEMIVDNPYHVFGNIGEKSNDTVLNLTKKEQKDKDKEEVESVKDELPFSVNSTFVDLDSVFVRNNEFFGISGEWKIDVRMFSLTFTGADEHYLSFLPEAWTPILKGMGFPSYSRDQLFDNFAVDFLRGWTLHGTSAFRGYLVVCNLILGDMGAFSVETAHSIDIEFTSETAMFCMQKEALNKIFHDENIITSLLTLTPAGTNNYFEPLRQLLMENMAGFSFWGLHKEHKRDNKEDTHVGTDAGEMSDNQKYAVASR